jgi:molecular chaperone DnaJ
MAEKLCYYDILGVERGADTSSLRKAYKKLALKYHPDRNNGSEEATGQFKEVTEAYSVLSDDAKRAQYDQFGHAGLSGAGGVDMGGDIFSHFQEIFGDFFGGFGGGQQRRRRGPGRGQDLRVEQVLSLEDAVLGCKKDIELTSPQQCTSCEGSGAAEGSELETCNTCAGRGQVSTARGFVMFTQTCPSCQGEGRTVSTPCETCDGVGWEEKSRTVTVSFPPGIDTGHRLRVAGQGMPGTRGGPPGNLYVDVAVQPHEHFERDGVDLICRATVSFPDAAMGTELEVTMLDGSKHHVEVPGGTQPGAVISAPGLGAPDVNGRGSGSLHVVLQVSVPRKLTRRAKKLLRQLEDELDLHAAE